MKGLSTGLLLLLLLVGLAAWASSPPSPGQEQPESPLSVTGDGSGDPDGDGECKAGCNAVKEAKEPLTRDQIARFLERVATEPVGTASPALETLLFHGAQVRRYLDAHGTAPLDPARTAFLTGELRNSHVTITLAVIDAAGRRRIELSETVPIGDKQHLHPETVHDVTPPEVSFTVQRVGLHHLWTRI